jgi:hypothetical protein
LKATTQHFSAHDSRPVAKGAYTIELVNAGKTIETGKLIVE